jgi:hypothetical protein
MSRELAPDLPWLLEATERARGCSDKILSKFQDGMSMQEIAEEQGVEVSVVLWWFVISQLSPPHASDRPLSLGYFDAAVRDAAEKQRRAEATS